MVIEFSKSMVSRVNIWLIMVYIWLMMVNNLVSGFNPSEKYELISWGDEIPNIWKNKTCSKPPTSRMILGMTNFS